MATVRRQPMRTCTPVALAALKVAAFSFWGRLVAKFHWLAGVACRHTAVGLMFALGIVHWLAVDTW